MPGNTDEVAEFADIHGHVKKRNVSNFSKNSSMKMICIISGNVPKLWRT